MIRLETITEKMLLLILPTIFFSSISLANEIENPIYENDSIYRYNALENKAVFTNFSNSNVDSALERPPKSDELSDDITEKLKNITDKQNSSKKQVDDIIENLNKRSRARTFLIGNKLGILKFQMVQIKDQTTSLEALASKAEYPKDKIQIASQIKLSKEEQEKIDNFIREKEKDFSLLGWLVSSL